MIRIDAMWLVTEPQDTRAGADRLLPPKGAAAQVGARERVWTAAARLEAVITTAAMDEAGRSAWCRASGMYPQQLAQWRVAATAALAEPQETSGATQQSKQDRRRIKEMERELQRKEKALAEAAALLVLSKRVEAIFNKQGQRRGRMIGLEDRRKLARDFGACPSRTPGSSRDGLRPDPQV